MVFKTKASRAAKLRENRSLDKYRSVQEITRDILKGLVNNVVDKERQLKFRRIFRLQNERAKIQKFKELEYADSLRTTEQICQNVVELLVDDVVNNEEQFKNAQIERAIKLEKKLKKERKPETETKIEPEQAHCQDCRKRTREEILGDIKAQNISDTMAKVRKHFPIRPKLYCCCVTDCMTSDENEDEFFLFPKRNSVLVTVLDEFGQVKQVDRVLAWKNALQIKTLNRDHQTRSSNKCMRVCSKHFRKLDYQKTKFKNPDGSMRKRLKFNAVPSQNLPGKRIPESLIKKIQLAGCSEEDAIMEDVPDLVAIDRVFVKEERFDGELDEIVETQDPIDITMEDPIAVVKEEPVEVVMEEIDVKEEILEPVPQEVHKIDTRCVVCLTGQSAHSIYDIQYGDITILKMLQLCTSYEIAVEERSRLQGICDICYQELLVCNSYRERFLKTQKKLRVERMPTSVSRPIHHNLRKPYVPYTIEYPFYACEIAGTSPKIDENERLEYTPLKCFDHFMGDVLNKIADYTNREIRDRVSLNNIEETCKDELLALVGLLVFSAALKNVNLNVNELFGETFMGVVYSSVISYERFKFLSEEIMFHDIDAKENGVKEPFKRYMGGVWHLFMSKCQETRSPTTTVARIEHYMLCAAPCPFRRFLPAQKSYGIKMISHYDTTNKLVLKAIPCTWDDQLAIDFEKCTDPDTIRNFGMLWSSFYCAQESQRWSVILFYAMVNIALINSYAMHCSKSGKVSEDVFLKQLADSLIMPWVSKGKSLALLHQPVSKFRCYFNKKKPGESSSKDVDEKV